MDRLRLPVIVLAAIMAIAAVVLLTLLSQGRFQPSA